MADFAGKDLVDMVLDHNLEGHMLVVPVDHNSCHLVGGRSSCRLVVGRNTLYLVPHSSRLAEERLDKRWVGRRVHCTCLPWQGRCVLDLIDDPTFEDWLIAPD